MLLSFELYEAGRDIVVADLFSWLRSRGEGVAAPFIEPFDAIPNFFLLCGVDAVGPVTTKTFFEDVQGSFLITPFFDVIPDAITREDDKLDASTVNNPDFWLATDHLRKLILVWVCLEFEVSEASGNGQLSLYAIF